MVSAVTLEGVSKTYDDFHAVRNVSFKVPAGRITGFLGPNGAGKTSTLRMILGLLPPSAGRISVLGAEDATKVRDRIGFLPEERGLYKRMTPIDAIAFFAGLKGVPEAEGRKRAVALLEAQGLGFAMKRPIKDLSKGMAQKVQLLSALAHEPELVVLDEPFSGLDPVNQQALETMIREIAARGATVLFSTHVMQHAERLCDKVVLMARGQKVFDGDVVTARRAAPRALVLEGDLSAEEVAALPGLGEMTSEPLPEGGWRHVVRLPESSTGQDALKAAFARDLSLRRFELKEPTLHDAFIVLTGGQA
ncbi:ABC transporter ATP-binding protein [Caulobacter sp. SL161]|uniref:ABC transporter ATP-binding protein n=1 Tax=Caulobacter sp. SL161 TaxID=2995156 RepID=UPI0022737FD6|nr:ABC transporter ATP-binding protein [Caulobacter sp. SL161]MCY1645607.1 ABC transporter ATP-binding protein [Caulobacter sp. SL161]